MRILNKKIILLMAFFVFNSVFAGGIFAQDDSDGDGIPDDVDNCPLVYNPGQEDSDSLSGYYFDFGSGSVKTGYTQVLHTTTYSADRGYGWTSTVKEDHDRGTGDDLLRDFTNDDVEREFKVDLPNGYYQVKLYFHDYGPYDHGNMMIKAEGIVKLTDIYQPAGDGAIRLYNVTIEDGQLNQIISTDKAHDINWILNGMEIYRMGDGYGDACDNCPLVYNPDQADTDNDGMGNACDDDDDNDGWTDESEIEVGTDPLDASSFPVDRDGDGILDYVDNCPLVYNPGQKDSDSVNQTIRIRALIDGRSQLVIKDNTIKWHHLDYAAPGRHLGADEPTYINGIPWMPWPEPGDFYNCGGCYSSVFEDLSPPLPERDVTVELNIIESRWETRIVQYPSPDNDYTLIIEFDDNPLGGDDWYEVNIHIYGEGDGIGDVCDNCPFAFNPDQTDTNCDGVGDACEGISHINAPATVSSLIETSSSDSILTERILAQKGTANEVEVTGDLNGTVNFTNFEIVSIETGSFAGEGFSKGEWTATLEGISYAGNWKGMSFLKPEERKIYLKGTISGEISAVLEGYLSESIPGNNLYDRYYVTWKLGRLGSETISGTIDLAGAITYQEYSEYPSTALYVLQTLIEGSTSGHYTGALSAVLTHLRIADETNPHYGEGFSIISYTSDYGSGEGWAYNNLVSPGISELNGLFTSPLLGIVSATLDESKSPRSFIITIERVDLGLPPMADLKVTAWGRSLVSPGETITYITEFRNDGLKSATDIALIDSVPLLTHFISASPSGAYDDTLHIVRYDFERIPPKTVKHLSLTVEVFWGLPLGTSLIHEVNHYSKEEADIIFQHDSPRLTDEAQIILDIIQTAATTLLDSPLSELISAGTALPDHKNILFVMILNVEKWRLDALMNRCPRDPCGCNAANYFGAIRGILAGLMNDPGYFKKRYPNKTFEEVIREIADKENYCLPKTATSIAVARDPNIKYGPKGNILPGQRLEYKVEYENEGEGIAFGVYFTDTLDEDLDDSTLEIGPVIDVKTGAQIAPPGTYNPKTRTITWFVGEVRPGEGGYAKFSVNVRSDAPDGTEIINFGIVYFPSVPETTRTNGVVNKVISFVDNIAPTTTASISPSPNQAGWNNTNVTITLTAADNQGGLGVKEIHYTLTGAEARESTISADTTQIFISTEGTTVLTYWTVDNAENTESVKSLTVKLDKTPPEITANISPEPNPYGWNNTDVTVTFSATDTLSGIATVTEPIAVTTEGANQYMGGETTDIAGNRATTYVTINIDKTPPTVTVTATPDTLWPPNHKLVDVTIAGEATDNLSGIASTAFKVEDEYDTIEPAIFDFGSIIPLDAWRDGNDLDGRTYTISVTAKDKADNEAASSTTVICPHDQRKK
ncbi:MAG: thrombospondin type 3 repeat-containing protein [Candidatus Omnitrophota bacterium]